jgi:Cof subfamily protein (haloacid dehalogenase superfamily)
MISMIALDLDGTLLAEDHRTVPSSAVRLLAELARSGVHIVPASGRALGLMEHEMRQLPFVSYVVSSNGASVFDRSAEQRVVRCVTLPACRAFEIYTLLDRYELSFELYHGGKAYLERSRLEKFRESFSSGFAAHILAHTCQVDSLVPLLGVASTEKFNVSSVSAHDRAEIVDFLSRFDDLTLTSSLGGNLEITAAGVSKASALVWLADVLGVRACDVVAFGDAGNDIGMLSWAGMSYAMGNGTEEAKVAARWVAGSNANDGVATALRSIMSRGEPWSVPTAGHRPHCRDVPWTQEPAR